MDRREMKVGGIVFGRSSRSTSHMHHDHLAEWEKIMNMIVTSATTIELGSCLNTSLLRVSLIVSSQTHRWTWALVWAWACSYF